VEAAGEEGAAEMGAKAVQGSEAEREQEVEAGAAGEEEGWEVEGEKEVPGSCRGRLCPRESCH
jgi:hypothetical protein